MGYGMIWGKWGQSFEPKRQQMNNSTHEACIYPFFFHLLIFGYIFWESCAENITS